MKIYDATGVTETPQIKVSKSVNAIIICGSLLPSELTDETISIFIERPNQPNFQIATAVPMVDFLMLANYGSDAIQSNATFGTIALCELCEDGAPILKEGETLQVKLSGLKSAKTYQMYATEDAVTVEHTFFFERKSISQEDTVKTINVENCDLCVIDLKPTISEVTLRYRGGNTTRYTPFELQTISRDIDPVFAISSAGAVSQGLATKTTLPLVGVVEIEIVKIPGDLITVCTRSEKIMN